jgi:hypothetical protein
MSPEKIITSEINWNGSTILLIGTSHGVHTLHEDIVNKLESFQPDVVLTEGNYVRDRCLEHRSARNYTAVSGIPVKPLNTMNYNPTSYTNHQDFDTEDFKKGPKGLIDVRKAGKLTTRIIRWIVKLKDEKKYEKWISDREGDMVIKMIYEIDVNNRDRVAVIFGRGHVIGIEKIFKRSEL